MHIRRIESINLLLNKEKFGWMHMEKSLPIASFIILMEIRKTIE
jgi:hypothetical protein